MCSATCASRIVSKRPGSVVFRRVPKLAGRERGQAPRPGDPHAVLVGVHADALGREMQQVAADAAADVERESRLEPLQVPAERRLDIEPLFPPGRLEADQAVRVVVAASRGAAASMRVIDINPFYQRAPLPGTGHRKLDAPVRDAQLAFARHPLDVHRRVAVFVDALLVLGNARRTARRRR